MVTIQLQKQNADHKSCAHIAINRCVVADDGSRVSRRHIDGVRGVRIGVKLLRTRQSGLQQGPFTQSRRATVTVPGSHRWGDAQAFLETFPDYESLPDRYQGHQVEVVPCPVKKGEVHFHHALTWHGSHANTSARHRRALAVHYMTEDTQFVASGEHVIKDLIEVGDREKLEGRYFPQVYP